jgi:hypothetical protein
MADAISSISTSAGSECETVEVAQMSEAGQIEQLFKNGEVQLPMSASGKAGEQLDGPLLAASGNADQECCCRGRATAAIHGFSFPLLKMTAKHTLSR